MAQTLREHPMKSGILHEIKYFPNDGFYNESLFEWIQIVHQRKYCKGCGCPNYYRLLHLTTVWIPRLQRLYDEIKEFKIGTGYQAYVTKKVKRLWKKYGQIKTPDKWKAKWNGKNL